MDAKAINTIRLCIANSVVYTITLYHSIMQILGEHYMANSVTNKIHFRRLYMLHMVKTKT